MSYAALADLTERFGATELGELCPDGNGGVDPVRTQQALDDAGAIIDSYLRPRYALPLPVVPPLLGRLECDLARALIYASTPGTLPTDAVKAARDAAMTHLRDLGAGKAMLDLPDGTVPPVPVGIGISRGLRGFQGCELGAFLHPFGRLLGRGRP
jgi:phage gp36-like protein